MSSGSRMRVQGTCKPALPACHREISNSGGDFTEPFRVTLYFEAWLAFVRLAPQLHGNPEMSAVPEQLTLRREHECT